MVFHAGVIFEPRGVAWYALIGGFIFGLVTIKLFSRKPLSRVLKREAKEIAVQKKPLQVLLR